MDVLYNSYTVWSFTWYTLYFLDKISSATSSDMDTDELDFVSTDATAQSRMYLLTYSCAGMKRFPNCAAFAHCVLDVFESGKKLCKSSTVDCL